MNGVTEKPAQGALVARCVRFAPHSPTPGNGRVPVDR
jgi:hypothetical protein